MPNMAPNGRRIRWLSAKAPSVLDQSSPGFHPLRPREQRSVSGNRGPVMPNSANYILRCGWSVLPQRFVHLQKNLRCMVPHTWAYIHNVRSLSMSGAFNSDASISGQLGRDDVKCPRDQPHELSSPYCSSPPALWPHGCCGCEGVLHV